MILEYFKIKAIMMFKNRFFFTESEIHSIQMISEKFSLILMGTKFGCLD